MQWFAPDYNVAPQTMQPVVRLNRDTGKREFALMRWGLVPYSAKQAKIGYSTINARAEEAATKPLFREALNRRRCLVPADAFYEWQRINSKTKRPFAFAMQSGKPYAFAGLWERWNPKERRSRPSPPHYRSPWVGRARTRPDAGDPRSAGPIALDGACGFRRSGATARRSAPALSGRTDAFVAGR